MFKEFQQFTLKIVDLVNSPGKTQRIIRGTVASPMILKDFEVVSQLLEAKGFFAGSLGEISVRTSGGKMLVAPGGIPISRMTEESLLTVVIDSGGIDEDLFLPKHIEWHRRIYQHSLANAVVLCQPTFACIMSRQGRKPEKEIFIDAYELVEITQCVKAQDIHFNEKVENQGVLLIDSGGVLVWESDLDILISQIEILERLCEISVKSAR